MQLIENLKITLFFKILPLLYFVLFSNLLFSQNDNYVIKGVVADSSSSQGIPYTTISVVRLLDNKIEKQFISNIDGSFEVNIKGIGEYQFILSSVGYSPLIKKLNVINTIQDIGTVYLKTNSQEIAGVTITAFKPLIKMQHNKIIYNIQEDLDAKSFNGLEILKKIPSVNIRDEKIFITGKGKVKIYINGKPAGIVSKNPDVFLKNIPATSIKNIEIIYNPGVQYDEEENMPILNITMNREAIGIKGSFNNSTIFYKKGVSFRNGLGFDFSNGKFGATFTLAYKYNPKEEYDRDVYSESYEGNNIKNYVYWQGKAINKWQFYSPHIELSFDIDSLQIINGSFSVKLTKKYQFILFFNCKEIKVLRKVFYATF